MTEKPQALQELESALQKIAEARQTIRLAKAQIKESVPKLRTQAPNEDQRLSIAKHLLDTYNGIPGFGKPFVARKVLDCSWFEMKRRLELKMQNCSRCGAALAYRYKAIEFDNTYFRNRGIPGGLSCLSCEGIPDWMVKSPNLRGAKNKALRRFSSLPFSLGDYTFSNGSTAMFRVPLMPEYGEPDYKAKALEAASLLESHLASGDLGFVAMPRLPRRAGLDSSWCVAHAGNKEFFLEQLYKINDLPKIEIAPKISGQDEPMVFRCAYGAGMLMPMKGGTGPGTPHSLHLTGDTWVETLATE